METPEKKTLFDPDKAKRGKIMAAVCACIILAVTIVETAPNLKLGNSTLPVNLVRIALVAVCGLGAVKGFSLAVFLDSAYASLAATHICVRGFYLPEQFNTFSMTLGVIYFVAAIVFSLSPSISENNKQRRFRDVQA